MMFPTTLAAMTLSAAALTAADPEPKFFNPEAEAAIRQIVRDELKSAALEAKPRLPPAPAVTAAGVPATPAPAGMRWQKDGTLDGPAPWGLVPAAPATPAFATPVRNLFYQFGPRTCPGGNCPR